MTAAFVARLTVSAIAAGQGIAPLFIDLNRTHATNPLWPGHARFHLVQQVCTLLLAAAVQLGLLWWPGGAAMGVRFYLAAALAGTSLAGFAVAALGRNVYGGALHDPNGIQPVRLRLSGRQVALDMNAVLVIATWALLAAAVITFRFA